MRRDLGALRAETFDVVVLGGGITGAGVALDATLRGLRVALVDKGDFASGTSSASTKLIHGGLRYLERGDFGLVYEALRERRRLLRNAPHLVRPLRFVWPLTRGGRVPPWKARLGLRLYDLLAGRDNLRRSRPLPLPRLRREFPTLRTADIVSAADYHDAQMDDARLCIEVLKSAADYGAVVANYVVAVGFETSAGVVSGVRCQDHLGGETFAIRGRQIVNATGPWTDAVRRLAGDDTGPLLEPTKGVHLVVSDRGLTAAFLLLHPDDGRVLFVLPWLGKTLLGTTDTFAAAGPDALTVSEGEVSYLLRAYNSAFDDPLSEADVLSTFAGLRPLVKARPGEPSARSREFRLFRSSNGLLTAAGGKYTTYRSMAEAVVDAVAAALGVRRRCRTASFRLDGAPEEPWPTFAPSETKRLAARYGLAESSAAHLVNRYGLRAADVAAYLSADAALARPVVEGEPDLACELSYQRDHEMAFFPADWLLRRTRLGLARPDLLTSPLPRTTHGAG